MIVESVGDVIKLSGDLSSNHWETIRTAAGLVLKRHPRGVVVDGSDITSCTNEGAQTFYDMMLSIEKQRSRIIVANLSPAVREALAHVPEVRSRLAIAKSVEEARHSLDLIDTLSDKKDIRKHATGVLILGLCGGPADGYATSLAAAIAQMRQLRVVALFPIVVPQALSTNTPLPEKEAAAEEALQRAQAILKSKDIPFEPAIERTRSIAAAVERAAEQVDERTAIISLPEADHRTGEPMKTADELLSKLTAEVILVREPRG
jgi:anti-anti-sigma regulatory factor